MAEGRMNEGVLRDRIREDAMKLQIVMQFLESRGLDKSLAQLQVETETEFKPESVEIGGVFDTVTEKYFAESLNPKHAIIDDGLPKPGVCATDVTHQLVDIHGNANPTCIAFHPTDSNLVVTGGADRRLIIRSVREDEIVASVDLPSPVLCVHWHDPGIAVGCMGGEVFWIPHYGSQHTLSPTSCGKPHGNAKVSTVKFSPDGNTFATTAKHSSVFFFNTATGAKLEQTVRCLRDVSAICWIDSTTILVAETDDPMIGIFSVSGEKAVKLGEICMNLSLRDPRTAYSALTMAWNSELRLLAVSTSRNSTLLFRLPITFSDDEWQSPCPLKALYGMSIGIYDLPSVEFSLDGTFLYVTSDKEILVFEIKSGHKIFTIRASDTNAIRGMRRHRQLDVLATVSFDKKLTIVE